MNVITRDQAIERRLTHYFTGKPCKRNHISQRYTKSLACLECLHPKFSSVEAEQREHLKAIREQLVPLYIILYVDQLEGFQLSLLASAMMREPRLRLKDLLSRDKPLVSGLQVRYRFNCFAEDEQMLLDLGRSMLQSHPLYVQHRESMIRAVNRS